MFIQVSNKKEQAIDTLNSMNKSQKRAEKMKPETHVHSILFHLYEALVHTEVIYSDRNQTSSCLE